MIDPGPRTQDTGLPHRIAWVKGELADPEPLLTREWLVTNALGGYASGSVAGVCTRRFHGLLVAALPAPHGRTMMLNHLAEEIRLGNGAFMPLGAEERPEGPLELRNARVLNEFRLENGLPVWKYEIDGAVLEKRLVMPHLQNTVFITYRLLSANREVRLRLRPSLHFRPHQARVDRALDEPYAVECLGARFDIRSPEGYLLRLHAHGQRCSFVLDGGCFRKVFYRLEARRGYEAAGLLWSPGYLKADLTAGGQTTLIASTEPWDTLLALRADRVFEVELERRRRLLELAPPAARQSPASELVLAADQFIIAPGTRETEQARAHAEGDEARSVIAGYPWFTDWGRDTMISLEGLTLSTGRHAEAGYILRTFGHYIRDGLIPNLFPEGKEEGLYHTADATLWFFHALDRYLRTTGDRQTLRLLLPKLKGVIDHHLRGTRFGIGVDAADGLLHQGFETLPLTWMDARVDGWVVTPRRGKAVEINALWYNALRLAESWIREEEGEAAAGFYAGHADRARESFNRRFWFEPGKHLYDIVDGDAGDDPALRPNQVFALSLPHAVLDPSRWEAVLEAVRARLVTPVGLRSLAPGHPDYKIRYDGDLRSRDAAYHQGTVWSWLAGPWVDAWLKVHPEDAATARTFLEGFIPHLGEACIGSISEVFDAEHPFQPRGCVAQAWGVAEVLRAWLKTETAPR